MEHIIDFWFPNNNFNKFWFDGTVDNYIIKNYKDILENNITINYKNLSDKKNQLKENFINEELKINYKDYYFSNVIARASKTMLDCHNSKLDIKLNGTNG